jgi:hypothetical protein
MDLLGLKMIWNFVDSSTLKEAQSGYIIHLVSGTWFHPIKLKPEAPNGIDFPEEIKLLKSGLRHIKSIGEARTLAS